MNKRFQKKTDYLVKAITLSFAFSFLFSCGNQYQAYKNIVEFDGYRFQILSNGLINVQTSDSKPGPYNYSDFNDDFVVSQTEDNLEIKTNFYSLIYTKGSGHAINRIKVRFKYGENEIISPINQKDKKNLGGVIKSVDRCDGRLEYKEYDLKSEATPLQVPNGLLSQQGWTVLKSINNKLVHNDVDTVGNQFFIFAYGNNYKQALSDFVTLNGKVPLLPKWSLGNWFSRYQPLTAQHYKDFVKKFREEKIPIDVIVPDMNWHIDGWFGTRYDSIKFPDMSGFLKWTNENGLHVGFNHHPGAVIEHDPRSKTFCEKAGYNYDSLLADTKKRYKESGWDFIEHALHYGEGNPADIKPFFDVFLKPIMNDGLDFHWVDGTPTVANLEEYYKLTEEHNNKRAIVLTRQVEGSFDNHRFPIGFSADTYISWESLKYNTELTVMGSNVGVYWSHDIGGHMNKYDENLDHSEMFARWIQSGALSPFCRLHATGGVEWDTRSMHNRRPWEWNKDVLNVARKAIQLKYKLMPYTYSLNRIAHDSGVLICHGMYIDYPEYTNAYKYGASQYMYGPSMLVAPITEAAEDKKGTKGIGNKNVWIPEGVWYDYFSGNSIEGPIETLVSKPINELPLFVKEGAIIPMMEYMEYTDQKPLNKLIVEFYQASKPMNNSFSLYEDDGKTLEYKKDLYRWTKIDYIYNADKSTTIKINPAKGEYKGATTERTYHFVIKQTVKPAIVSINGTKLKKDNWKFENKELTVKTEKMDVSKEVSVTIKQ